MTKFECPCRHGATRLTVIEHDDAAGRTYLTKPVCTHRMGEGTVEIMMTDATCGGGNGAREALLDIIGPDAKAIDRLLMELWVRGFKVVPLDAADTRESCDAM
jgi:hypothetical protein